MFLLALVGPDWLDLFLLLLIFLIGIYGYRQGPIYVIVSFLGAFLGFVLGLLVGPPLSSWLFSNNLHLRALTALATLLVLALLFQNLGLFLLNHFRTQTTPRRFFS